MRFQEKYEMDLIYYYSSKMSRGFSVSLIGTLRCLLKRRSELPFDRIKLFTSPKDLEEAKKQFPDVEIISFKDVSNISRDCLIHIPVGPLIYPNSKFLLHLFAVFKRRKLILHDHGDLRTEMRIKWKYMHRLNISYIPSYIFYPYLLKSADKLFVHSYKISKLMRFKYGVKNDVVVPLGLDDFWFEEGGRIELEGEPTIFYHGRLAPEKGVDLLIKGFAEATKEYPKARLYIGGTGPLSKYLMNLCRKFGIAEKVIFLGWVKPKPKPYLSSVNAAIYPSIYEPFSLAILEAFSSVNGPVYYSSHAGINDAVIRAGYSFNVFEPNVENITKIIKDIIEGNYDKEISKKQKEFARRYTHDNVADHYIKIYNSMIQT